MVGGKRIFYLFTYLLVSFVYIYCLLGVAFLHDHFSFVNVSLNTKGSFENSYQSFLLQSREGEKERDFTHKFKYEGDPPTLEKTTFKNPSLNTNVMETKYFPELCF